MATGQKDGKMVKDRFASRPAIEIPAITGEGAMEEEARAADYSELVDNPLMGQ